MANQTEVRTHQARQSHKCTWCWECISSGTKYKRYRNYNEGDVSTEKMHLECYEVMKEAALEEGGYIEWIPGRERPRQ